MTAAELEDDAYHRFLKLRWPPDGKPVCPRCGCRKNYVIRRCRRFRCSECKKHFSATGGTIFANRKLPFVKLMAVLERRDLNALRISKEIGVQYKVAWVLCHKLREVYAKGESVSTHKVSAIAGYFQHRGVKPDHCRRCGAETAHLLHRTFELQHQSSGWFCEQCVAELQELQQELARHYENARVIKQFEGEVNDYAKEHG